MALCKFGLFSIDMAKIKTAHQRYAEASTVLYSFNKILITVFDVVNHSVIISESMETNLRRMGTDMLKWYGHVVRMEGNRWPKRIITWSPRGRQRRVRAETKWGKELESLMKQD
jgi:hypothetical protein